MKNFRLFWIAFLFLCLPLGCFENSRTQVQTNQELRKPIKYVRCSIQIERALSLNGSYIYAVSEDEIHRNILETEDSLKSIGIKFIIDDIKYIELNSVSILTSYLPNDNLNIIYGIYRPYLNIYGLTFRGETHTPTNVIFIFYSTSPYVLAHEFGHICGLNHSFSCPESADVLVTSNPTYANIMNYSIFNQQHFTPMQLQNINKYLTTYHKEWLR